MGSSISPTHFSTMIMSSLPPSYRSVIQTITAAKRIGATQGTASKPKMTPEDMINFFTEEAHHRIFDENHTKVAGSALLVHGKKDKRSKMAKMKKGAKPTTNEHCNNCGCCLI